MKLTRIVGFATLALLTSQAVAAATMAITNAQDKLSYTIGADLGTNFKKQEIAINADLLSQGIKDAQTGAKLRMTQEEMASTLKTFQQDLIKKRTEAFKQQSEQNKKDGSEFLSKNKAAKGIVTTASGLQYRVLNAGAGAKPTAKDTVTVNYTGRLVNGNVFDSTSKTGKPVSFRVNEVIPGWTEALQMMPTGATWEIFVPSNLAYGDRGIGGPIGPNQTLIFKIQLLDIKKDSNKEIKKS